MTETAKQASHRSFFKQTQRSTAQVLSNSAHCPCRLGHEQTLTYGQCCAPYHQGLSRLPPHHAPDPEALMRSRYSAYVLQLGDYLLATWYGETSPGEIDFPPTKWLGLEVHHSAANGDVGVVEFVARYRDGHGRAHRLVETSRFLRQGSPPLQRWFYIDGLPEPVPDPQAATPD